MGSQAVWSCPACTATLSQTEQVPPAQSLSCVGCEVEYPLCWVGEQLIPWLFVDPITAAADWQARYSGFIAQNQIHQDRIKVALYESGLTVLNRERLERQLYARELQLQQISRLLMPLGFIGETGPDSEAGPESGLALGRRVDKNQGLMSYHANVFRDWSWNNGENEAQLAALLATVGAAHKNELGNLLVLGAGAGRLSYDLQQELQPASTTLLDCNPLLLIIASRMFAGQSSELYEFPTAPLNSRSHAVLQHCANPGPPALDNVRFVLADALRAPFANSSFDTVLTPWLLDILPCDLADFIPQLNRLLPIGGTWLNTGSVVLLHPNQRWCYSEEEVLELVAQQGFRILHQQRQRIPYLQSPHSAHGRVESVLSFSAEKIAEVPPRPIPAYIPDWVTQPTEPVPSSTDINATAAQHLLVAQVLSAIDGNRSLAEISLLIAKKYALSHASALVAVRQILLDATSNKGTGP